MSKPFEGKVALVTGSAGGIGQACAERLARDGASVVLTDVQAEKGEAVAAGIRSSGGAASFLRQDVTQEDRWIEIVAEISATHGGLDILVNNAGIGRDASIVDMSLEHWRLVLGLNLEAMFLGVKHCVPLIKESGGGSIVNLSSTASDKPFANMSAYCASKAGIKHFTKVAALECAQGKTGIRVNSVHPGAVDTPAWDTLGGTAGGEVGQRPDLDAFAAAAVPLGFIGKPADIADTVAFLVGNESRYITGANIVVDGGLTLL